MWVIGGDPRAGLASISLPQGSCGYTYVAYYQRVERENAWQALFKCTSLLLPSLENTDVKKAKCK